MLFGSEIFMKLVNCPVCGCRCSADAIKCPECDFNIKEYFNSPSKKAFSLNKKLFLVPLLFALIMAIIIFYVYYLTPTLTHLDSKKSASSSENVNPESTETNTVNSDDIVGVYSGDDHEILVINDDNLAYYYCAEKSYTELQCPWYIEDNKICIDFSRIQCTVSASINNTDELIFKAAPDSINWNTEIFTKIDLSPEDYLGRVITPYDINTSQNNDGTMNLMFDGINYTIPKEFIDLEDDFDSYSDCSLFVSIDPQNDYVGALIFYCEPKLTNEDIYNKSNTTAFIENFLDDSTISSYKQTKINGYNANIYSVSGNLNKNFSLTEGSNLTGYSVAIDNTSSQNITYIMLIESKNRVNSKGEKYILEILDGEK